MFIGTLFAHLYIIKYLGQDEIAYGILHKQRTNYMNPFGICQQSREEEK